MREDKRIIIKNLLDLDLKINTNIIRKNAEILSKKYIEIENLWNKLKRSNFNIIKLKENSKDYDDILKIARENYLSKFEYYNNFLKNRINDIIKLSKENVTFYYINKDDKYKSDKEKIIRLFREIIILSEYFNNKHDIVVIWVPINRERKFSYDSIDSLESSIKNYEAFTASGVTFGENPRYTIISRYEEIDKLLLHELIHNLYLDGSNYHHELCNEIKHEYEKIKKKGNYDYEFAIYESYTELLSSYLNLIFKNLVNNFRYKNLKELEDKLFNQIIIELLYSYNLICNLININGYKNFDEFLKKTIFKGEICFYEYYFLKALLYNNYVLEDNDGLKNTINNYRNIINVSKKDELLEKIYKNYINNDSYSYVFYNNY